MAVSNSQNLLRSAAHRLGYSTRAEITKRLIREKGFQAVAAEADSLAGSYEATLHETGIPRFLVTFAGGERLSGSSVPSGWNAPSVGV